MKKRGSINLGISTVVVLVIAMVVIAAGISFIRTFFNTGEEKLLGAFEIGDFGIKPDRNDPLVIEKGRIRVKAGSDTIVRVGFYNTDVNQVNGVSIWVQGCSGALSDVAKYNITSISQDVLPGRGAGYETIFGVATGIGQGNYICTLKAATGETGDALAQKQVIVEVTG